MLKYKNLIRSKSQEIQSLESSLRSLSYILPGRFKDSEFVSELIYSCCNLFSLLNASILCTDQSKYLLGDMQPSPHNRYTKSVLLQIPDARANLVDGKNPEFQSSNWLPHLSYALAIIKQCEIVLEMAVYKWKGDDARWKLVGIVETTKCLIKSLIFNYTQNRLLLGSPVLEPEPFIPSKVTNAPENIINDQEKTWVGKRTGIERPFSWTIKSKGINYLLVRAVAEHTPLDMVKPLTGIKKMAEYLYIFRPLIYLALIRKCEKQSWKPWLISLALEILALLPSNGWITESPNLTSLEHDEIKRRQRHLLFYLFKAPFYQNYSKSVIDNVVKSTETKPLLSIFSAMIKDYQPLWENYHFYTNCGL